MATKFGFRYKEDNLNPKNSLESYIDGSPEWIKVAVENSLRRLNTDVIDLYYAHRIDPNVPVEDTIGAMADLVKQGKVRYLDSVKLRLKPFVKHIRFTRLQRFNMNIRYLPVSLSKPICKPFVS